MEVKWNKPALEKLGDHLEYVAQDSPRQSYLLAGRVMDAVNALSAHPLRHPPDKYKRNEGKSCRAFTQDNLRISYRIFRASIHIIRVRHVKQKPRDY